MFCKWCGKKITNNGVPCPSCGRNQDALENGNGFWDLCRSNPKDTTSIPGTGIAPAPEKRSGNPKTSKEMGPKRTAEQKRSKARLNLLLIATSCLLLIAIITVCIGIYKTGDWLSELNTIRADISNLNEHLNGGVEKIAEPHAMASLPVEDQPLEDSNKDAQGSIDELIDGDEVLLLKTYKLRVDRYALESEPAYTVFVASGDLLTEENMKLYWQGSVDGGATWQTLAEDAPYFVAESSEDTVYRILCLMEPDSAAKQMCYYVLTDEPVG